MKRKRRAKYFIYKIFILLLFLSLTFYLAASFYNKDTAKEINLNPTNNEIFSPKEESNPKNLIQENISLAKRATLNVPFTSQAPNANWDPLHEEACEEASLLMVKHFIKKTNFDQNSIDQEIIELSNWQEKNGYKISITTSELLEIANNFSGLSNGIVKKNITISDIKKEISLGRPVIIPAAGKLLENPNFRNGGPVYHMLVVIGYDENGFITNDPGTRKGKGYRYSYETLFNAIHDWDESDILNGPKNYLVFE